MHSGLFWFETRDMENQGQDSSDVSTKAVHATRQTTTTTQASLTAWLEALMELYPGVRERTYFVHPDTMQRTFQTTKNEGEPSGGEAVCSLSVPETRGSDPGRPCMKGLTFPTRERTAGVVSVHMEPFHRQESENKPFFISGDHPVSTSVLQHNITDQNNVYASNADVVVLSQSPSSIARTAGDSSSMFSGHGESYLETLAGRAQEMTVNEVPENFASNIQESDIRDDYTQRLVLHCLQYSGRPQQEVMFVISQLNFRNYLNNPEFQEAASTLPKPRDLKSENKHRGDFDILIIHRNRGLIACEIKSVGNNFSSLSMSQLEQDLKVEKRIRQCIKQLYKEDDVLNHLTSDLPSPPKVTKTPMLPHISREQLKRVLQSSQELKKELCLCLGLNESADPSAVCLTSDDMNDPTNWWSELFNMAGVDDAMTEDVYLQLVSRFAGPATILSSSGSGEQETAQADDSLSTEKVTSDSETASKPLSPRSKAKKSRKKLKKEVVHVPTDNQSIISHRGPWHRGASPADCVQCGKELAQVLIDKVHNFAWGNRYAASQQGSFATAVLQHGLFPPYGTNIIVTLHTPYQGGFGSRHPQYSPAGIIRGLHELCTTPSGFPRLTIVAANGALYCPPSTHATYCNPGYHDLSNQCLQIDMILEGLYPQRMQADVSIKKAHTEVNWI